MARRLKGVLGRRAVIALATGLVMAFGPAAEAGRNAHLGSGYGVAGGVNPDLALANVFSGIYGLGYTYDRAHYDFNGCRARAATRFAEELTIRPCR